MRGSGRWDQVESDVLEYAALGEPLGVSDLTAPCRPMEIERCEARRLDLSYWAP